MMCSSQQYQNCLKDSRSLPEGDADIAITARWKEGDSGPGHRWCLKQTTHCFTERVRGRKPTKRSIPLCADFMTYYLHQSFAGPQPSAKDLLSWNQSANYIVTGGFESLARKCNKINKNHLGKFCLTTHFFPIQYMAMWRDMVWINPFWQHKTSQDASLLQYMGNTLQKALFTQREPKQSLHKACKYI